ncbi:MAG: hypothetical protein ACOYW3_00005, partial [Bacteroidota bacterium]
LIGKACYAFRTNKGRRYLVLIHEYEYKVFVIKFHDARYKNSALRFNMMTGEFDCGRVLRTVIEIAALTLRNEPLASFAFVGVYKIGKETKDTENSQRHRIYMKLAENFLGGQTFIHSYENKSNCYLLVNKANENPTDLHGTIVEMFAQTYQELSHL